MTVSTDIEQSAVRHDRRRTRRRRQTLIYLAFILPAVLIVVAIIVFPWLFTLYMSTHDFAVTGGITFVGADQYMRMLGDRAIHAAFWRTLYFTALSVIGSLVLGIFAAVCFHQRFPLRGLMRTVFLLPMMATPVALALVWTMMLHPQLGVLNYILTSIGLPPSMWVYNANTVIPTLALIETWHWTPLVMLIVLGGMASLPTEPNEAAQIDGANPLQVFWHVTLPQLQPFIITAALLRTIDALKTFDMIFVITGGGPGTASETINMMLYKTGFAYYDLGYASAIVVVFFVFLVAVTGLLVLQRKRSEQI